MGPQAGAAVEGPSLGPCCQGSSQGPRGRQCACGQGRSQVQLWGQGLPARSAWTAGVVGGLVAAAAAAAGPCAAVCSYSPRSARRGPSAASGSAHAHIDTYRCVNGALAPPPPQASTSVRVQTCSSCFWTVPCCSETCLSWAASSSAKARPAFLAVRCFADSDFLALRCADICSSRSRCCICSSCWVSTSQSSYCRRWGSESAWRRRGWGG